MGNVDSVFRSIYWHNKLRPWRIMDQYHAFVVLLKKTQSEAIWAALLSMGRVQ
jgi:hypothetical protein